MRINVYVAQATGLSRRQADNLVRQGKIEIDGRIAELGSLVQYDSKVMYDGRPLQPKTTLTIMLNKPVGYVVSRNGQGSKTIYSLLPKEIGDLKPIGRLDKNSSGLLLLTNDGNLAQDLTHPSKQKDKLYEVEINKQLEEKDIIKLNTGIELSDGMSRLKTTGLSKDRQALSVVIHEGRNRQIRRTFEALGYKVTRLHRTKFGNYSLNGLSTGKWKQINIQ